MLSTKHYLHLVFDYANDLHYTDTLLTLDSDAYLWYILRQQDNFDVVVFVKQTPNGLRLLTLDTVSRQALLMKPEGLLGSLFHAQPSATQRRIARSEHALWDLGTSEAELLQWIAERLRLKELKKKSCAFVFTAAALETAFRSSPLWCQQALRGSIAQPDGRNVLVLQLSPQPEKLADLFLKEDALLPLISQNAADAVNSPREPLADSLDRHMDGQIHKLHLANDVFSMFLHRAVKQEADCITPEEMASQAAYLRSSLLHYGRLLATDPETACMPRHRDLYETLAEPRFRSLLGSHTMQLQKAHPDLSVSKALALTLPPEPPSWLLPCNNSLIRNLQAMPLPREDKWQNLSSHIIRRLKPMWNKPQNKTVLVHAALFCESAWNAAKQRDWGSAWDALQLLDFCADQVCADRSQDTPLAFLFQQGQAMLSLSHNVFISRADPVDLSSNLLPDSHEGVKLQQEIFRKIAAAKNETELMNLYILRQALKESIRKFSEQTVSSHVLEQVFEATRENLLQEADEIQHQQQNLSAILSPPEPEDLHTSLSGPEPLTQEELIEQGRLAGEKLLRSEGLY